MEDTVEDRRRKALQILKDLPPVQLKGVRVRELFPAKNRKTGARVLVNREQLESDLYIRLKSKKRRSSKVVREEPELLSEDEMAVLSIAKLRALSEYSDLPKTTRETATSKAKIIDAILSRRGRRRLRS